MTQADLGRQRTFDWGVRTALGREDFLVAHCNEAAVAWLDRWPDWPGPAFVIHGPPRSGKSHLAEVWRRRSGARAVQASALAQVPSGDGDAPAALVVDGLAAPLDERALLHTYNSVAERGGHLLLTALAPPALWPLTLPDLVSRLRLAPEAAISLPDDALLAALVVKLFVDRQIAVAPEVPAYVVPRIERSFEAVARLVERLDRAALAEGRPVTVPLARRVLALGEESSGGPPQA